MSVNSVKKIFILLPVHNRRCITTNFVDCLLKQTFQSFHLILIDDGSTDGTEEMVRSRVDSLTVLKGNGNWWWGGSLHQGYLWLKGQDVGNDDIVLTINDDIEFDENYINKGISILQGKPKKFVVSNCVDLNTGELFDIGTYNYDLKKRKFSQTRDLNYINCCNTRGLFMHAEDFLRSGGFRPKLLPHYLSDIEFSFRFIRQGLSPIVCDGLILKVHYDTTRYEKPRYNGFHDYLKKTLSKKYASNPLYFIIFYALVSPSIWKVINPLRIAAGYVLGLSREIPLVKRMFRIGT